MYVFIKNDHFNKKFSFLKCRFSTFLFSNQVKNFDESVLPVNTQWKYIWIFLLSTPSVWPVNVSRPNFTWHLSVLPALRVPGLFCVHCSALNRIVKLSDIFFFSQLVNTCIRASQEGREENNSILILSSTSHDLTASKAVGVVTGRIISITKCSESYFFSLLLSLNNDNNK